MNSKNISLLLALVLVLSCLTGCGTADAAPTPSDPPATEQPADDQPSAAPEDGSEADEIDLAKYETAYGKYAPDTVVMTVNGQDIKWADFFGWVYNGATQLEKQYGVTDWSEDCAPIVGILEKPSYSNYVRYYAESNASQCAIIAAMAKAQGITLTAEDQAQLETTMAQYVSYFGDQEAFEKYLSESYLTEDYFRYQNEVILLYNALYASMFGTNGEKLPDQDAIDYAVNNGYLYAKHILLRTVDDSRQPLDEATVAQKKAEAEGLLTQLQACSAAELPAKFDALMQEHSEDTGLLNYPDGYYFHQGEMVAPFEEAVLALEENGLSGIVESDFGYHIIFRPAMDADHIVGYDANNQPYGLRSLAAVNLFDNTAANWYAAAKVEYAPDFENFDLNTLFAE